MNYKTAPGPGDFPPPDEDWAEYFCANCNLDLSRQETFEDVWNRRCSYCGEIIDEQP